jgi:hypothetical protein
MSHHDVDQGEALWIKPAIIPSPTQRDVAIAERLVIVHQGQDWPTGHFCRNCRARWPCRLQRWGLDVLLTAGWVEKDIADLAERANGGDLPWQ